MNTAHDKHLDTIKIQNRLKRIEGQIRGISGMLEENRRCEEIITQLSAINAAITNTAREILYSHIEHSVGFLAKNDDIGATVDDLRRAIESFGKLK